MRLFIAYWICTIAFVGSVWAQPQRTNRNPPAPWEEQLDDTAGPRYQLALGYLRGMQFDRAIVILRELRSEYPEQILFFDKLKESYVSAKRYEDAIALLDHEIPRSGENQRLPLAAERAQMLYLSGDEPSALASWYSMVESASGMEIAYRIAYNSMIGVRLLVQAIDLLKQGREEIENPNLFHAELAYLYSLTGQHELATLEYLDLLTLNEGQLNYIRGRLGRDMQQEGASEIVLRITEERVSAQPDLVQLRELLAWLYEENRDYEQAYREIIVLEKNTENSGQRIHEFALRTSEASAFAIAAQAFQAVLETHPQEDISVQARLGIADMYRLQAERTQGPSENYQKALNAYEQFTVDFPEHSQIPFVLVRIAALHQDVFRSRSAAREILERLATRYAHTSIGHQAQFDLGRLTVEEGALDEALTIFMQLSARIDGELLTRSKFEEALIHFYMGKFSEIQSILNTIRDDTDKETANDAIALRVLLLENPEPDSTSYALLAYAKALLLLRQHQINETVHATQDILAEWGRHPVADDTRFLRAEALIQNGQIDDAAMVLGEFPLIHPESPLRDRSLFQYAEILETIKGDTEGALQAYTDLLTKYPGSLLVSQTRERIRALRGTSL